MPLENGVARLACRGLETAAARPVDGDRLGGELDAEAAGEFAAVIAPAARFGLQLVVDVYREQRLAVALSRCCASRRSRSTSGPKVTPL
jgi:hypothetical protein